MANHFEGLELRYLTPEELAKAKRYRKVLKRVEYDSGVEWGLAYGRWEALKEDLQKLIEERKAQALEREAAIQATIDQYGAYMLVGYVPWP